MDKAEVLKVEELGAVNESWLSGQLEFVRHNDEEYLDAMRQIVRQFVQNSDKGDLTNSQSRNFKAQYENIRKKLRDATLQAFSSFDFLEKMYRQEQMVDD